MFFIGDSINFGRKLGSKDKGVRKRANWRASSTPVALGQQKMRAGKNEGLYNTKANVITKSIPVYSIGAGLGAGLGASTDYLIGGIRKESKPFASKGRLGLLTGLGALGTTGMMAYHHKKELERDRYSPFYRRDKAILGSLDNVIRDLKRRR